MEITTTSRNSDHEYCLYLDNYRAALLGRDGPEARYLVPREALAAALGTLDALTRAEGSPRPKHPDNPAEFAARLEQMLEASPTR